MGWDVNSLWFSYGELTYRFYFYVETSEERVLKYLDGTVFDFMSLNKSYIVTLVKVEFSTWTDTPTVYEMATRCQVPDLEENRRKQANIKLHKEQKKQTFSKFNNNWNKCKYNKRFK